MLSIPEGGAVGQCLEDRRVKVAELQAVFRNTGFPFHMVPLEQVSVGAAAGAAASSCCQAELDFFPLFQLQCIPCSKFQTVLLFPLETTTKV